MTSEVDFAKGASVSFEKSKIMKTYNAIKLRMQSRFTKNGVLDAKLFLVSSKKSEQDFIESYIETVKNDPSVMICDDSQWAVKPPGTFSNKRFKVAVGNKKLHSKIVMKDDNIEDLKKQGFRIIDVPLELQRYFQRDIERALMDLAGISTSLTTKFISYDSVAKCYSKLRKNPFGMNILEIGTEDKFQISDFFHPELISEALITKPIFIHFDMSLTGDRTGISAVASVGAREELQYVNGDMSPVKELLYAHLFSVGIQCPAGAEISLEKNRKFVYYLKYALGWNIQGISADGFQSRDTLQQFTQSGFNTRLLSLDRTPDGYLYTKASLNERRISMLEIPELETELINLERNNMTGKVDHPVNASKDIADSLAGALTNASENTDIDEMYGAENFDSMFDINDDIYVSQNKYMKNYLDNIAKNNDNLVIDEELKADFTQEFDNQVDRLVSKSEKLDKEMESKIQKERMDKIKENESKRMSNNSFEKSFFNDDNDGFIIW